MIAAFAETKKSLRALRLEVQEAMAVLSEEDGIPDIGSKSQLLRPLVSVIIARGVGLSLSDKNFLRALTASQVIHEASLYHDDVIDEGKYRRGEATLPPQVGNRLAVMQGDRFIAAAFKLIASCASVPLMQDFARTIEGIIDGEVMQNQGIGKPVPWQRYRKINAMKTGGLFAFAMRLPFYFKKLPVTWCEKITELSLALGTLYQDMDDCLDYNIFTPTGKPAYQDFRSQKWTLVLRHAKDFTWEWTLADYLKRGYGLEEEEDGTWGLRSLFKQACDDWLTECSLFRGSYIEDLEGAVLLEGVLDSWKQKILGARAAEEEACLQAIGLAGLGDGGKNSSISASQRESYEEKLHAFLLEKCKSLGMKTSL